jgi:3-dehydrotetronate 4-kinase
MILGVIADDFTGATDVAGMLVRAGMRTVQVIGVPQGPLTGDACSADAVVVALKSRTTPAADAVRESLAALASLRAAGARQIYFKYCSTFDSTAQGNIGPVADALMQALDADFTIACPAFPENGRTIFRGHLFVGEQLLSDSGMRDHPLTPMTDANLVRVLQAQTQHRVGLLRYDTVARGAEAVRARASALQREGVAIAIADAVSDADLLALGEAFADLPLITAGSGVALGLPPAYARRGWLVPDASAAALPEVGGLAAVLSGSCSQATNLQVRHWIDAGHAAHRLDPLELAKDASTAKRVLGWALDHAQAGPVLVHATAEPDDVRRAQHEVGVARAGELVEKAMGTIAAGLVEAGVRRLVVAGGETSGAVVQALGVTQLLIGEQIDPGVPWTQAAGRPLLLALKSGNFGAVDFFAKALARVR